MTYRVLVDDNDHYMDESERYELGEFPTLDAAIGAARKVVDEYLESAMQSGVAMEELLASYLSFGEDPFIVAASPAEGGVVFSARDYARQRCEARCAQNQDHIGDDGLAGDRR